MNTQKIANLLSMACRAGKVVCGDFAAKKYLKKKRVPLIFLAADGSEDTTGTYRRLALQKHIHICDIFTKEELGRTVGKEQNVVVLLTDPGFAKAIDNMLTVDTKGVTR